VKNELRLKKELSAEYFLCGLRDEAEETVEYLLFFFVKNELRLKKQLSVECFLRGVRAEAEETVELRHVIKDGTTKLQ